MKINNGIKILNNILNNIGAKGFQYSTDYTGNYITLWISPSENSACGALGIGQWSDINNIFDNKDKHEDILNRIINSQYQEKKHLYIYDYSEINQNGVDYLRCICKSSSLEELKLRLQIMGYDI